jgi:hypothetical protein
LEKLMLELGKIRKIILVNGKEVVSEITKKQREIIDKLNLNIEYVPKNKRVLNYKSIIFNYKHLG